MPLQCTYGTCTKKAYSSTMCPMHWARLRTGLNMDAPIGSLRKPHLRDPHERFWSYVDIRDGCWNWTGFAQNPGPDVYGRILWYRPDGKGRSTLAPRLAFEFVYGPLEANMTIDHHCTNTLCVRPDHLELVSRAENSRRARANERPLHSWRRIVKQRLRGA